MLQTATFYSPGYGPAPGAVSSPAYAVQVPPAQSPWNGTSANAYPQAWPEKLQSRPESPFGVFRPSIPTPSLTAEEQQNLAKRLCYQALHWYQDNKFIHDKLYKWINLKCPYGEKGMPSCSHFSEDAIKKHGVLKGIWMTFWRIVNCNWFTARKLERNEPVRYLYA